MSWNRVIATEKIYDVLHGAGLDPDHACFDDLMFGCMAAVEAGPNADIVDLIYNMDTDCRTKQEIAFDLVDYAKNCNISTPLVDILKKAVAIGKAALLLN